MNEMVKNSIDARKNAIYNTYEVTNDKLKKEIDELFDKIYEYGKDMKDQTEFESKFPTSPLNQEYIDMFTKVAQSSPMVQDLKNQNNVASDVANMALDEVEMGVDSLTHPMRHKAYQAANDKIRSIPIVGDILTVKQHTDLAKSLTGGYVDDKEEE